MSLVIIDTSVWVDYLRRGDATLSVRVDELIRSDEASISGVILGEVLCGSRDSKEFVTLNRILDGLHYLDDGKEIYREAANLAWQLRSQGLRVPLSDLTIAAQCWRNQIGLLTRDSHFGLIESALGKPLLWTS